MFEIVYKDVIIEKDGINNWKNGVKGKIWIEK